MVSGRSWIWLALAALHCGPRPASPAAPEPAAAGPATPSTATPASVGGPEGLTFVETPPEQGPAVPPVLPGYENVYVSPPAPNELPVGEPGQAVPIGERSSRPRPGELARFYPSMLGEYLKLGYAVADFRVGRRERSTSLVHPSGPRVLLRMTSDEDSLDTEAFALTRPATPRPMPGPCVEVPTVGFEVPLFRFEGARRERYVTEFAIDLDNDGVFDAAVPIAATCHHDVRYALYVTRGGCGHHVGTVGPGSWDTTHVRAMPAAAGLKDLEVSTYKTIAAADASVRSVATRRKFAFDGTAYREVDTKVAQEPCSGCTVDECLGPHALPPEPPMPADR